MNSILSEYTRTVETQRSTEECLGSILGATPTGSLPHVFKTPACVYIPYFLFLFYPTYYFYLLFGNFTYYTAMALTSQSVLLCLHFFTWGLWLCSQGLLTLPSSPSHLQQWLRKAGVEVQCHCPSGLSLGDCVGSPELSEGISEASRLWTGLNTHPWLAVCFYCLNCTFSYHLLSKYLCLSTCSGVSLVLNSN